MATDKQNYAKNENRSDKAKQCCNSEKTEIRDKVSNKPDYDKYGTGKYSDCGDDIDDIDDADDCWD